MDKLRKVGSHFHRNRGKYLGVLCAAGVITIAVLYKDKRFWHRMNMENHREQNELIAFIRPSGIYDDFIDHLRSQGR
jgi:hypothetical protein